MVEATLLTLQKLTQEEKNVLKTFEKRINALYPFKQQVSELIIVLDACKQDISNKGRMLSSLNSTQSQLGQMFANLDFTSVSAEKEALDAFAREKRLDFEDLLRDQAAGGEFGERANKKISQILRDKEEELRALKKIDTALEHFTEAVVLFRGMIKHERQVAKEAEQLIQETKNAQTPLDIDHVMHEWRQMSATIEKTVLQEKTEVFDRLQPLLQEKTWAEQLVEKYSQPRKKWLIFTQKITKEDIQKDMSTIASHAELDHYKTLLMKHANILAKDAYEYLIEESKKQRIEMTLNTHLATYDRLTGLLNRHSFEPLARQFVELAQRQQRSLSLILLDIDNFGQFNKKYGTQMGDKVLAAVASIVRKHIRRSDAACRWGGEEWFIIAPDTGFDGSAMLAETLRKSIEQESVGVAPEPITASFGVAILPQDGVLLEELMKVADDRMRSSKAHGKNRVTTLPTEPKAKNVITSQ
jgi:diguanylate cyclase (GGDEF)-like protein